MANFNLNDYETVEQRLARFYADHADGRIITENLTTSLDRQAATWVVKATVFFSLEEQLQNAPKATGLAFEVDGVGMANKTSALENAETSAIGRALANAGYSGNKRTSREEMAKVARDVSPKPVKDWLKVAEDLAWQQDREALINLYNEARQVNAPADVVARIKEIGAGLAKQKDSAK